MANKRIRVSELDFDGIKANLKEFLRGQDTFSDYDFEGSNLSILVDLLAYNTHYNAMYTNFALNEAFIDSASKRDSVVSIAKGLGYTPRSAICAKATVNIVLAGTSSTPPFVTIPKNTPFFGNKDGVRYYFYNADDITAAYNSTAGTYTWSNVVLREGKPITNSLAYTVTNEYVIPNIGVDTTTLNVSVVQLDGEVFIYKPASNVSLIDGNSDVYFLHEIDGGFYRISFGDGVLGSQLEAGSIVVFDYLVTSGSSPNDIKGLSYGGGAILGSTNVTINMQTAVIGGKNQESIDEIRFNAPQLYATQDRAVTIEDFKHIIKAKVPFVDDVIAWGGESATPPVYGKVFVSCITPEGANLTDDEKYTLEKTIEKYKIATIQLEHVDAEFIDIGLDLTVYYDETQTNKTPDELRSAVYNSFNALNNNTMGKFGSIIRNSTIMRTAEVADPSIINVIPKITLYYNMNVLYNTNTTYEIKIGNPIANVLGSIKSNGFYSGESQNGRPVYIYNNRDNIYDYTDEATQKRIIIPGKSSELWLYEQDATGKKFDIRKVGDINFNEGKFTINKLAISSLVGSELELAFLPASRDVVGFNNKVIRLDMNRLTVTVVADSNINGQAKNSYNFVKI